MTKEEKKKGGLWSWIKRRKWWIILVAIVAGTTVYFMGGSSNNQGTGFATATITKGDLRQVVTATGEIQPLNTINVGSQVSGTIEAIYVDYNSKVKKGDVLLKIEPSVLQASVDEAYASLVSSESQRNYAKSEYERNKTLFDAGFISRAELEQSQTTYEQAEQNVNKMKSQYDRAVTNLGYATITSPVDGTVISRQVDVGQTVAASFQTPDLFEIAEDLSQMQIETSVSEADIGMIAEGQSVTFTVDAYPSQTFEGFVRQVRLSPTITSNVVVYTVVIDVDNTDLRLKPGMTAFVTILISEKKDIWKVQNSALILRSFDGIVADPGDATPSDHLAIQRMVNGEQTVVLVPYEKGLVTATETEIISDEIQEGDRVIFGRYGLSSTGSSSMRMGPPR